MTALIQLDEAHSGILRFALAASPLRRQAIFLTLSALRFSNPDEIAARLRRSDPPAFPEPLANIAHALMTFRVRDIVHALHGPVDGLVGCLHKLGDDALHPVQYRSLVALLTKPEHHARAKVLRQMQKIKPATVAILLALRPPFIIHDLVQAFGTVEDVYRFNAGLDLIYEIVPHVEEEELIASIRALGPTSDLGAWLGRWTAKATTFPLSPPIRDDRDFRYLGTAAALRDAAARYRNCLRASKLPYSAVGRNLTLSTSMRPRLLNWRACPKTGACWKASMVLTMATLRGRPSGQSGRSWKVWAFWFRPVSLTPAAIIGQRS